MWYTSTVFKAYGFVANIWLKTIHVTLMVTTLLCQSLLLLTLSEPFVMHWYSKPNFQPVFQPKSHWLCFAQVVTLAFLSFSNSLIFHFRLLLHWLGLIHVVIWQKLPPFWTCFSDIVNYSLDSLVALNWRILISRHWPRQIYFLDLFSWFWFYLFIKTSTLV